MDESQTLSIVDISDRYQPPEATGADTPDVTADADRGGRFDR